MNVDSFVRFKDILRFPSGGIDDLRPFDRLSQTYGKRINSARRTMGIAVIGILRRHDQCQSSSLFTHSILDASFP